MIDKSSLNGVEAKPHYGMFRRKRRKLKWQVQTAHLRKDAAQG